MEMLDKEQFQTGKLQPGILYNVTYDENMEEGADEEGWQPCIALDENIEEEAEDCYDSTQYKNDEGEPLSNDEDSDDDSGKPRRKRSRLVDYAYTVMKRNVYYCPHCSYYTKRKDHFKRHILRHPGQNIFPIDEAIVGEQLMKKCTFCDYMTMRADHFKRHMMRHTGERPYVCHCGFASPRSVHLRHHLQKFDNPSYHFPVPAKTFDNSSKDYITLEDLSGKKHRKRLSKGTTNIEETAKECVEPANIEPSVAGYFCLQTNGNAASSSKRLSTDDDYHNIIPVEANVEAFEEGQAKGAVEEKLLPQSRPSATPEVIPVVKRKRGRPRKHPLPVEKKVEEEKEEDPLQALAREVEEFTRLKALKKNEASSTEQGDVNSTPKKDLMKKSETKAQGIKKRRKKKCPKTGRKCPHCSYWSLKSYHVKRHVEGVHQGKGKVIRKKGSAIIKEDVKTKVEKIFGKGKTERVCEECGYRTTRSDHMKRHLFRHEKAGLTTGYTLSPLKANAQNISGYRKGSTERVCNECGYKTTRSDHMKRHLLRHEQGGSLTSHTLSPVALTLSPHHTKESEEIRVDDEDKKINDDEKKEKETSFVCTECGYTTLKVKHYRKHLERHKLKAVIEALKTISGSKKVEKKKRAAGPNVCETCSFTTTSSSLFKQHMLQHSHPRRRGRKPVGEDRAQGSEAEEQFSEGEGESDQSTKSEDKESESEEDSTGTEEKESEIEGESDQAAGIEEKESENKGESDQATRTEEKESENEGESAQAVRAEEKQLESQGESAQAVRAEEKQLESDRESAQAVGAEEKQLESMEESDQAARTEEKELESMGESDQTARTEEKELESMEENHQAARTEEKELESMGESDQTARTEEKELESMEENHQAARTDEKELESMGESDQTARTEEKDLKSMGESDQIAEEKELKSEGENDQAPRTEGELDRPTS